MKQTPALPRFIFASRWLQLPLYLGLIAAQAVYVFHFWVELVHLIEAAFGSQAALDALVTSIGYKTGMTVTHLSESITMLVVLGLMAHHERGGEPAHARLVHVVVDRLRHHRPDPLHRRHDRALCGRCHAIPGFRHASGRIAGGQFTSGLVDWSDR